MSVTSSPPLPKLPQQSRQESPPASHLKRKTAVTTNTYHRWRDMDKLRPFTSELFTTTRVFILDTSSASLFFFFFFALSVLKLIRDAKNLVVNIL